jgi:hypothetical protein
MANTRMSGRKELRTLAVNDATAGKYFKSPGIF